MKYKKLLMTIMIFMTVSGSAIADLTTGLVAYYPFNGNANDESGNGNNGTVYGTTLTTDRFGKANSAYSFDGINNYIGLPNEQQFDINTLTISVWIKGNKFDTGQYTILSKLEHSGGGVVNGYELEIQNSLFIFEKSIYNYTSKYIEYSSPYAININTWYHFVSVFNSEKGILQLYVNGNLAKEYPNMTLLSKNNNNFQIGRRVKEGIYFNGILDDIRIYNRTLLTSEIQQLYKEGTNQSPTITSFTATPKAGNPPLTVNFAVTVNDPDSAISAYQWDFTGDGRLDDTTTTGKTLHTYNDLGIFKPNVTIVDNKGAKTKSSSIPITVQYGPDLVGELRSYNFNNETNTIQIDFKVTNAGDISARQFPVTFNLSNNGTKVVSTFKNLTVDGLAAGESKALKVDYTFDASIYGQYILILVDPTKNAAEVDETNNGTRIVVQPMATK